MWLTNMFLTLNMSKTEFCFNLLFLASLPLVHDNSILPAKTKQNKTEILTVIMSPLKVLIPFIGSISKSCQLDLQIPAGLPIPLCFITI